MKSNRALAIKADSEVSLYSRRKKSFKSQYPYIVEALSDLPDDTVVDGEIVSLDDSGRPNFHLLQMPFVNLPDEKESRCGDSLTAEKIKQCVWLRPEVVAQIEFLEWTAGDRLRHSKLVGLRDDKDPRMVVKEQAGE